MKKVARQCPLAVDVIFVLMQLGITVMLGFFSYFYDALNRPCVAAYGNTVPLTPVEGITDATVGINVQEHFKMAIRFGFYLSILNFGRVAINQVSIWYKN